MGSKDGRAVKAKVLPIGSNPYRGTLFRGGQRVLGGVINLDECGAFLVGANPWPPGSCMGFTMQPLGVCHWSFFHSMVETDGAAPPSSSQAPQLPNPLHPPPPSSRVAPRSIEKRQADSLATSLGPLVLLLGYTSLMALAPTAAFFLSQQGHVDALYASTVGVPSSPSSRTVYSGFLAILSVNLVIIAFVVHAFSSDAAYERSKKKKA